MGGSGARLVPMQEITIPCIGKNMCIVLCWSGGVEWGWIGWAGMDALAG